MEEKKPNVTNINFLVQLINTERNQIPTNKGVVGGDGSVEGLLE